MDTLYVRKGAKKSTVLFFSLLFLVVAVCGVFKAWFSNDSFLKYSKADFYNPILKEDEGFTGRVNKLLANLLNDTLVGNKYDIKKINTHYNSLKFQFSIYDSSYSYLKISDVILSSITPKNEEDNLFFHDSYLKDIIEKQHIYRNTNYFDIKFDDENGYRIKSIKINPELYRMRLSENLTDSKTLIHDPILDIDSNAIFFISRKSVLPVFSGDSLLNKESADGLKFLNTEPKIKLLNNDQPLDFLLEDELYKFYSNSKDNKSIRILLDGSYLSGNSPSYIRISNKNGIISYLIENTDSLVCYKNGIENFKGIIQKLSTVQELKPSELPVKFTYKKKNGIVGDFYLSKESAFEIASRNYGSNSIYSQYSDLFTKQFVTSINGLSNRLDSVKNRKISLNPLFSQYLEKQINIYSDSLKNIYPNDVIEMSMSVIDTKSGEIIASPFYSTEFQEKGYNKYEVKNFNLNKHFIGSTFKPLLANASSILYPALATLNLGNNDFSIDTINNKSSILGYPFTSIPFSKNGKYWKACTNRTDFLSVSNDLYPIAMVMLSLTEKADSNTFNTLVRNGNANRLFQLNDSGSSQRLIFDNIQNNTTTKNIEDSRYINLISKLYGIKNDNVFYNLKYSRYDKVYDSAALNFNLGDIPGYILPELVTLNSNRIGSDHTNYKENNSDITNLTTWVLGQGGNEWTNIQLASAYSRLFTKRDTRLSYFMNNKGVSIPILGSLNNDDIYEETNTHVENEWSNFLDCFSNANNVGSLLKPARDIFNNLYTNSGLTLVAKTGSPAEYDREEHQIISNLGKPKYFDEGLYSCGILNHYNTDSTSGINCVIHIRRITLKEIPKGVNGINSFTARDFLTADRFKKIVFFNQRQLGYKL